MNDIITIIIIISVVVSVIRNILNQGKKRQSRPSQGRPQVPSRQQMGKPLPPVVPSTRSVKEYPPEVKKEDWRKSLAKKVQEIQRQMEMAEGEFPSFPRPKSSPEAEYKEEAIPKGERIVSEVGSLETESLEKQGQPMVMLPGLHEEEKKGEGVDSLFNRLGLHDRDRVQDAIILSEIMGPPKSLRRSHRWR